MDKQMWLKMKEQIEKNDERIARVLQEEEKKKCKNMPIQKHLFNLEMAQLTEMRIKILIHK